MQLLRTASIVLACAVLVAACDDVTSPEDRVASVAVTPDHPVLAPGLEVQLDALPHDTDGNEVAEVEVAWSTSDPALATVDAAGKVRGLAPGSVTITARVGAEEGTALLSVMAGEGVEPGTGQGWRSISAGTSHSCGILRDGKAYCWGGNSVGQLGDGTRTASGTPRPVAGGLTFVRLSAGQAQSCGLATDGATYCWGVLYQADSDVPRKVSTTERFTQVSTGHDFACGLTVEGGARCWGAGSRSSSRDPITPQNGAGTFSSITSASHGGCALRPNGEVLCWTGIGFGSTGLAGAGSGITSIDGSITARGIGFVCALAGGAPRCSTGYIPGPGGQIFFSSLSALPGGLAGLKQISAGGERACALDASGTVVCWARRITPELFTYAFDAPVRMAGSTFALLSVGDRHSCALTADGQAFCWGGNGSGELGAGTIGGENAVPVRVSTPGA